MKIPHEVSTALDRIDEIMFARDDLPAVRAYIEALAADAARYRWLRDGSLGQWEHPIAVSQERTEFGMRYVGPLIGEELDAAIDAASKKPGAS
jgi:hypothetical protein